MQPQAKEILNYITEFETLGLQLIRGDQICSNQETHLSHLDRVAAILQIAMGFTSVLFKEKSSAQLVQEMLKIIHVWKALVESKLHQTLENLR